MKTQKNRPPVFGWVYYIGGNGNYVKTGAGLLVIYLE
jgi:hypothetical protein